MGAGLAVVAVVGAALSYLIVQPATLFGSLATVSLSGSAITLAVALLAASKGDRPAELQTLAPAARERQPALPVIATTAMAEEHVLPT